jgi:hypothetical protein
MAQGILPFKYESEKNTTGMTALAGLPVYLDLAKVLGLSKSIQKHLKIRESGQGWTDSQTSILKGFAKINKELAVFSGFQDSGSTAILDMDATLVTTNKIDALFSYKGYKAYQPLNT